MTIKEIYGNLFDAPKDYYLCHCINGAYTLGAGIAKEFDSRYNMADRLKEAFPYIRNLDEEYDFAFYVGRALKIGRVFNLVTKARHFNKPTYVSLKAALMDLKRQILSCGHRRLAMPLIGCGLDRLEWKHVKDIISYVFEDTDVDILVYRLEDEKQ